MSYINNIGEEDYTPPGVKKITKKDLASLPFTGKGSYSFRNKKRLIDNSPDMQQTAKLTFMNPNPLHKKYPDKVDVLGYDTKSAQKVSKLPSKGWKGQVLEYKGKLFVAGDEIKGVQGKFRTSQRTIADYAKGKSRTEKKA